MRLSKQHKQILLILLRNNPNALRLSKIVQPLKELKMRKWLSPTDEGEFPKSRVLSASFARSLKTLHEKGLVTFENRSDLVFLSGWRLTTIGLSTAREIGRELERQIEELNELKLLYKP